MRIAIVAPIEESIPPKKYGGIEWVVYNIATGIGKKGHQVDLYAPGDSEKNPHYRLIPVCETGLRTAPDFSTNAKLRQNAKMFYLANTIRLLEKEKYDIIHNHAAWRFLIFSTFLETKSIVTTHHNPLDKADENFIYKNYKNSAYISISNNQRKDLPELHFIDTIYNGINTNDFPFFAHEDTTKHDALLFFARMSPEKGAIEAANAALASQRKLMVGAKVDEVDKPYFEQFKPYLNNNLINFVGEVAPKDRLQYYQNARCLIAPIKWEEPFGLMFTESMSCGTPVIAYANGSAPEIIVDGETGLLVNESEENKRGNWITQKTGIEGLREAIDRMFAMPNDQYTKLRHSSRKRVEDYFSLQPMVDSYEKAYQKLANQSVSQ